MSDFSTYRKLETARIGSNTDIGNASQVISQSHQRTERVGIANLSATVAESPVTVIPYASPLKAANLVAGANAVANTTDYTVVTLSKRTGNGAAVVMATANLANVAVTKFVPIPFVLTANAPNAVFAAGDLLTLTTALTGNGTANNAVSEVDFLYEDIA